MSKMKKMFKLGSKKHVDPAEWTKTDDKLVAAIQADDLEKIEQLMVKKGVIPTKTSPQGFTALHLAALEGKLPVIRLFQEKDVDLTTLDCSGKTPLHCACKGGHLDVIAHLLQMCPETLTSIDHNDLSPIHHACLGGSLPATRHLLRAGGSVDGRDKVGRTPLFIAARLGNLDLCKELLNNHADINQRDFDKRTALMFAAEYEQTEVVEYLVRRGANALLTDSGGLNATGYAKQTDNEEIVKILENAPSRASWSLDKPEDEKVEETEVDQGDVVARFEHVEDDPVSAPVAPSRKPKQAPPPPPVAGALSPPPGFGAPFQEQEPSQLEKLEQGVVPMDEALAADAYTSEEDAVEAVRVSQVGAHPVEASPQDQTDNPQFSPEAVAAVEAILQSTGTTTSTTTTTTSVPSGEKKAHEEFNVDPEAYRELEEEHEYLNRELQQVSKEKKHLEEKVEVLERRLSGSDTEGTVKALVAPVQSVIDSTLVETLEEELAEAKMQLSEDKEKITDLEDEVKLLRKQIDIDSKPEAERSADDSWNDSDDDLFESVSAKKNSSSGLGETAVVASLRSRVLSLESEIEELKSKPKIQENDGPGSPVRDAHSESATERDLESLTQYSMLQQAHDAECHQLQARIETLLDENFIIKKQLTAAVEQKLEIASMKEDVEMNLEEMSHLKTHKERELEHIYGMVGGMQRKSSEPGEFEKLKQYIESAKGSTSTEPWAQQSDDEKERLRQEIQTLKQALETSERENERLNLEFNEIHSQVQGLEGLAVFNNELTQENDRLKEEIKSIQSSENASPRDVDQKEIAHLTMQLQQENNDLKSENRSLKSEIADIESSLKETIALKGKERLEGNPVDTENDKLRAEIQTLKQSLEQQKGEVFSAPAVQAELPPDTEELKTQITHLKRTVSQQDETIMELMQQSTRDAQLRYDYERLQTESEMMNNQMKEFQSLFSGQGQEHSKRIQDLEQEIQSLLEENVKLKSASHPQVALHSTTEEQVWESKITELRKVNRDLENEKEELETQVSNMEIRIHKLEKEADDSATIMRRKDTVEEEKLVLEEQVAQLAVITLQAETSSSRIGQLEAENIKLVQERDELYNDISTWKEEIGKLEAQLSANSAATVALEKIQQEYNTLIQEKLALEKKVIDLESQDSKNEPAYFDLKSKVKELEAQLEREQSATVMAILDGRTAEQQSTENNLKEDILSLTNENESLRKEIDHLKQGRQNGNSEDVMMLSAVSLQSSPRGNSYSQPLDNHRLGSSLKKRSEEFRLKEVEEENDRLKTEISKLKLEPYGEVQQAAMEKQLLMMQDKLESMEKRHRDVVSTYRAHLLRAVKGHMDTEVQQALLHIVKIRQAPEVDV